MDFFIPNHRRDGNAKVDSLYVGVSPGGQTVTALRKPSADGKRMETTRTYSPGLARGEGGQIATLVLGGMETTLDEMEFIAESKKQKKFIPRRDRTDIVKMCRMILERRNQAIRDNKGLATKAASAKPKVTLHLPVGYRYVGTKEPGLKVLARI